ELPKKDSTDELELLEMVLFKTQTPSNPPSWRKEHPGRIALDTWGWQSPLTYSRTHPVDLEYYKNLVIRESWKWGANLLHYWNWSGEEFIHDLLSLVHEHDMIYDEHWFPPRYPEDRPLNFYRIESTMDRMNIWADNVVNALEYGWMGAGDGWIPEESAKGDEGASSSTKNVINTNHTIWLRNPGAYTAVFTGRPNERPTGACNTTDVYKGPNFIYAVATQGGKGIDDKFSHRIFYENTGFSNEYNDLFLYLQGDCRPTPHRGPFGGRTDPDWMLKQVCDFFRPRAKAPEEIHETGIFWILEGNLALPDELRDYIYVVTMDPMRAAVTWRLSSTGIGGSIWNVQKIGRAPHASEYVGPAPRFDYPASTSFIQNNYLRLYRYALGDKGVLKYDTEHLAHYDSNSLSISLSESFIRTVPSNLKSRTVSAAKRSIKAASRAESQAKCAFDLDSDPESKLPRAIGNDWPAVLEIMFTSGTGTYMLTVGQPPSMKVSTVKVSVDGLLAGMYRAENIRQRHEIPIYVHGKGKHCIKLELTHGEGHEIDCIELENTGLEANSIKSVGAWDDSPKELKHHITKGVGGYEYGEFQYPYCYFDMDEYPLSEFPAGLAYGFPDPLNLTFSAPKGAYLLVLGAKARLGAGSLVRVALNPDAALMKNPDYVPPEWFRYTGEYEIPGDGKWHKRIIPVNLYKSNKNRIQLKTFGREGHYFDALEIVEAPVKHKFVEYGGHKAVLDEEFTMHLETATVREKRRYIMYNHTPYFTVQVERNVEGETQCLTTMISCEGYVEMMADDQAYTTAKDGIEVPKKIVLKDPSGLRPDLIILLLEPGLVSSIDWDPEGRLSIHSKIVEKETLKLGVAVSPLGKEIDSPTLIKILGEKELSATIPENMNPLEITNSYSVPLVRVLRVVNPDEGPYFVEENGWWTVRGGQSSREEKGVDYLKVYLPANGSVKVQKYGYIRGVVKPGYGCQHTVAVKDIKSEGDIAECTAKVISVTPALFAPRVQFKGEVGKVWMDGEEWCYYDEKGLVLLPNKPGEYSVKVSYSRTEGRPHLTRTCANISRAKFSETKGTLEIDAELPPWVRKLHEKQYYKALICYDKKAYEITQVTGTENTKEGKLGNIITFKPGHIKITFGKL
ncbi:MAG: hypothetical protein NWF14_06130, partial [Candidatus Bathyarchaeota archaeon]|nr:hypothetical protein [Candidatus Bathyarchaeota archaeon]